MESVNAVEDWFVPNHGQEDNTSHDNSNDTREHETPEHHVEQGRNHETNHETDAESYEENDINHTSHSPL